MIAFERATLLASALTLACGAAPRPVETVHDEPASTAAAPPPIFATHGAVVLRSSPPSPSMSQPPLYAELAADGAITGTRCGATRLTNEGVLEREGEIIALVIGDSGALRVENAAGRDLGWSIVGSTLRTGGDTRFVIASGVIAPTDPELPSIAVDPPATPDALALGLFATLLVCDDLAP